jgi:uncharacterized damage-inducible protein DinB
LANQREGEVNSIQTLTRYKAWADQEFLAVVASVPEAALVAPRPIYFGSLIRTLHHSYAMDFVWQSHLLGRPHGLTTRNPKDHPPLGELIGAQLQMDEWYVQYADSVSGQQLEQMVSFEFIGGGAGTMSRNDILLHVVNHTTYHRGHVADMLYDLGIFPPATDLPVFLRARLATSAEPVASLPDVRRSS